MPRGNGESWVREIERTIVRIKGVTSAGVILDDSGEIEEIHLLGLPSRRPKQIVRDTESLLYVKFGIRVDYRKISFAQLAPDDAAALGLRLQLISAKPHPKAEDHLQVILQSENARYEGVASIQEDAAAVHGLAAAADATLDAVQKAIGAIARLTAQETQMVSVDGSDVCLVIIQASTARGEERLTGTCIVRGSPLEAAARATLDAMNRRLPVWVIAHATESDQTPLWNRVRA